jgi:hypothetical protein
MTAPCWPYYLPVNPCCGSTDPCANPASNPSVQSSNLIYTGPNLPCTGIDTNDTLSTVIQKIEEILCGLITTTTTTTSPL